MSGSNRPLSPHLQVYKPQLTSVLSITHRATGVALAAGTILLTWWIVAAASGEESFNLVKEPTTGVSKGYAFCEFVDDETTGNFY